MRVRCSWVERVVDVSRMMKILKVACWDVKEGSPITRSVSSIGIISGQEIEILFRWSKWRVVFGVDLIDPQFLQFIIVIVDLGKNLAHNAFREELMTGTMFPAIKDISGIRTGHGGKALPRLLVYQGCRTVHPLGPESRKMKQFQVGSVEYLVPELMAAE